MSFNFFPTKWVLRVGQDDGIYDFVAFDLSGEKRHLVQFPVGEFHSAIWMLFDPLVAHSGTERLHLCSETSLRRLSRALTLTRSKSKHTAAHKKPAHRGSDDGLLLMETGFALGDLVRCSDLPTSAFALRQFSSCQRPTSFASWARWKHPSSAHYLSSVLTISNVEPLLYVHGQQPTSSTVWQSAFRKLRQRLKVRRED
jgi:hypothetical protein